MKFGVDTKFENVVTAIGKAKDIQVYLQENCFKNWENII